LRIPQEQRRTTRFSYARLLGLSLMVSFLGSLPPGTTNLLTIRLASSDGLAVASRFSVGCMMAELIYVSASLFMVDRILRFKGVFIFLRWLSVVFLLAFSVALFLAAGSADTLHVIPSWNNSSPFVFGFALMIINPVQFPFWLGWATVLAEQKVLKPDGRYYLTYAAGAGLGSLLASLCFILLGQFVVSHWFIPQALFHTVLGTLFLVSGILQVRKLLGGRISVTPLVNRVD
jgi:threonine/homoserine/homoserine lactone efflux protein